MSTVSEGAHEVAQWMMNVSEIMAPIKDATQGYRNELLAEGHTTEAASQMAADFHGFLLCFFWDSFQKNCPVDAERPLPRRPRPRIGA